MSTKRMSYLVLTCDGCGEIAGREADQFENETAARAKVYADGWRFPNRVNSKGKKVRRTSDVCPKCLPGWTPAVDPGSAAWTDQRKQEHAEAMERYRTKGT